MPQIQNDELSEMFGAIDNYLADRRITEAEGLLGIIQTRPDVHDVETSKRIVEYRAKIDNAKVILQATSEIENNDIDKAQELFRSVLDKDPQNADAKAGLAAVAQKRAEQGKIVFNYDGNLNDLDLYIDDVYQGHPDPEMSLSAGIYSLRIEREGYETWTKKVQLSKSDSLSLDVELGKKAAAKPAKKSGSDGDGLIAPSKKQKSGKRQQGLLGI